MIYFFCGAPKHGSHFQLFIVTESLKQKGVSYQPVGDKIFDRNDVSSAKKLLDSLETRDDEIFVAKGHFLDKKLLLSYQTIRVFHIWRELGDVLVSRYHYRMKRYGETYQDFSDFYWRDGRAHMFYQIAYQHLWRSVSDPRVYHACYEDLRKDFQGSAPAMLQFSELPDIDLVDLEQRISLDTLKRKQQDAAGVLFRRGSVGEYRDVIPQDIYQDMRQISSLNSIMLKYYAVKQNPKVLLSPYYTFPGKSLINKMLHLVGSRKSRKETQKSKSVIWWK